MEDGIDDWIDVTTLGDNYQVHMSPSTNRFRHRRWSVGGAGRRAESATQPMERAWIPGKPPSGHWADKKETP